MNLEGKSLSLPRASSPRLTTQFRQLLTRHLRFGLSIVRFFIPHLWQCLSFVALCEKGTKDEEPSDGGEGPREAREDVGRRLLIGRGCEEVMGGATAGCVREAAEARERDAGHPHGPAERPRPPAAVHCFHLATPSHPRPRAPPRRPSPYRTLESDQVDTVYHDDAADRVDAQPRPALRPLPRRLLRQLRPLPAAATPPPVPAPAAPTAAAAGPTLATTPAVPAPTTAGPARAAAVAVVARAAAAAGAAATGAAATPTVLAGRRGGRRRPHPQRRRRTDTAAPAATSAAAVPTWPILSAMCSGVRPSLSTAFTFAPAPTSIPTTRSLPSLAAPCSGVQPSLSTALTSAPAPTSTPITP